MLSLVPSLPSANKNLVLVVKNDAKRDFKVFLSCPILHNFLTLLMMICRWMPTRSHNQAEDDHMKLSFLEIRVENGKRGPLGFQFFAYFYVFDII